MIPFEELNSIPSLAPDGQAPFLDTVEDPNTSPLKRKTLVFHPTIGDHADAFKKITQLAENQEKDPTKAVPGALWAGIAKESQHYLDPKPDTTKLRDLWHDIVRVRNTLYVQDNGQVLSHDTNYLPDNDIRSMLDLRGPNGRRLAMYFFDRDDYIDRYYDKDAANPDLKQRGGLPFSRLILQNMLISPSVRPFITYLKMNMPNPCVPEQPSYSLIDTSLMRESDRPMRFEAG